MKIVIIGGTGLIGSQVAGQLRQLGHTVIAGSPSTGINSLTGEGIAEAMSGTNIVIDLSNSPSFDDEPAINFFQTSGRNLMAAELNARVEHHLALSIVGVDKMQDMGYMRAKKIQEDLIRQSGIPYTIVRSTQFLEFLPAIASGATQGNEVHVSDVAFQPIAAKDVAPFVTQFALIKPGNFTTEIAGPERKPLSEFVAIYLKENVDTKNVITNGNSEYYGTRIPHDALVPHGDVKLGHVNLKEWLSSNKK